MKCPYNYKFYFDNIQIVGKERRLYENLKKKERNTITKSYIRNLFFILDKKNFNI